MAGKRLTRKEIVQEDQIHSTLTTVYEWGAQNSKLLVIVLVVAAMGFVGSYVWQNYRQGRDVAVQKQFADALEVYHAPLENDVKANPGDTAPSKYVFQNEKERSEKALSKFSEMAKQYPGTELGQYASYYVAICQSDLGKKEEAEKELTTLAGRARQPLLRSLTRSYLAQLYEASGNHGEAIKYLNQIVDDDAGMFPKQTALMAVARNYEAQGKIAEAVKYYKRVTSEYPASADSREAQMKVDQLDTSKADSKG